MQLVAYGAQDIYLTGNPQITFFKVVYRRHTNFSMEEIAQSASGSVNFGSEATFIISRNGDLVHKMYVEHTHTGTAGTRLCANYGSALLKEVELEIGGQRIDKHYGEWLHIWNELSQKPGLKEGYANMVGNVPRLTQFVTSSTDNNPNVTHADTSTTVDMPKVTLYIPLQFWFCKNPGLSLPLVALQYHDIEINVDFEELSKCKAGQDVSVSLSNTSLYVDYIYLDTDERRRFAQASHEYLIEQVQFTGSEAVTQSINNIKLSFNHPVKELIWVVQKDSHIATPSSNNDTDKYGGQQWFNFTDAIDKTFFSGTPGDPLGGGLHNSRVGTFPLTKSGADDVRDVDSGTNPSPAGTWANMILANMGIIGAGVIGGSLGSGGGDYDTTGVPIFDSGLNPVAKAKIQLNGSDRFSERDGRYFNLVQPYQHHTNIPSTGINVYSFGLTPEEHQPSGTCNMSRVDKATLQLTLTSNTGSAKVRVYALGYNVLRIMSGMGGLAYST